MSRLWRSLHETLQYVSQLIWLLSVKIISKSLGWKDAQLGLDRAHVFMVDCHFYLQTRELFSCGYSWSIFIAGLSASESGSFFLPE